MAERSRDISRKVREFYNSYPFPGYKVDDYHSISGLYERSSKYAKLLDQQIPYGVTVLDAGCGTGQLAALLSIKNRTVIGFDLSERSIEEANQLKQRLDLSNVTFAQMDLFTNALAGESFDYVLCNGVLHHTHDPYGGFKKLCDLTKRGGYIIVGLYNTYGRLLSKLRGLIFNLFNSRFKKLDYFLRRGDVSDVQKEIWCADQYKHPHETTHTIDEVLGWFRENSIEFIKGVPRINLLETTSPDEKLFVKCCEPGGRIEHLVVQLGWILTGSREGGFFVFIGRRM
jgi:SAM-dependent methyltransferase